MLKKRLKIFAAAVLVAAVLATVVFYYGYVLWYDECAKEALNESQMIVTDYGPIEYGVAGEKGNPVILMFHGGGTGYDMIKAFREFSEGGFYVICASRSGVLRTPYDEKATFAKSADMSAALLDKVGIQGKVHVLALSLGGPPALEFAIRHPDKTKSLVMMDAVSKKYIVSKAHQDSFIGRIFMSGHFLDLFGYLQYLQAKYDLPDLLTTWLSIVTTYDDKQCKKIADKLAGSSLDRQEFFKFLTIISPMSLRYRGMMQETEQALNLPRYPLEKITAPALVTHSRVDGDVSFAHGEFTAQTIPHSELYAFDGNGHLFFLGEEWPQIRYKVLEFLRAHN